MIYIYGLVCPVVGCVRYVGKTVDLNRRLKEHLYRARPGASRLGNWIASLRQLGLVPSITVLREVPFGGDWESAEVEEISAAKQTGLLTNISDGGYGLHISDPLVADAVSKQRSEESRQRWSDPEYRERVIVSLKKSLACPERQAMMAARFRAMHSSPEFKARHREKIKNSMTLEARRRRSDTLRAQWAVPEIRQRKLVECGTDARRARCAEGARNRWFDPEKRAAGVAANQTEAKRKKLSDAAKQRVTPEYRAMMSEKTRLSWEKRRLKM